MEKILNFFKSKAIGYYLAIANIILALVLTLVFFATYKGAMANNASALVPETIGIFLIAGMVIEAVVLVIPQYRFVHIGALVMFGLALYKEVILIPNLIADEINNVHYQGGDLNTQVFYLVMLIIIVASAIAAAFFGFYKSEEETNEKMKLSKGDTLGIVKVGVCGVVVLAAVLTSSLVSADLQRKMNLAMANQGEGFNPITEDIKKKASEFAYDFDPTGVIIKEQEEYTFTGINSQVSDGTTRDGHNMVFYFEGAYAEGYQGNYDEVYGYLCLWDDGLFGGKINSISLRGYWFNSSIAEGNKDGKDIKDCLRMVTNIEKYESIIAQDVTGFYQYQIYVYLRMDWQPVGHRSMGLGGYYYYPEVAMAIDPTSAGTNLAVGDFFDKESLKALRIIKNLTYSAVFKSSEVKWTWPEGMLDKNDNLIAAGDFEVQAKWNNFEATATISVAEAQAEE